MAKILLVQEDKGVLGYQPLTDRICTESPHSKTTRLQQQIRTPKFLQNS
jgi:hypothetical protein